MFWRPAENAAKLHQPYLGKLVSDEDVSTLVSEEAGQFTGFLIVTIGDAPGVCDPGGPPEPGDSQRGTSGAVGNGGTGGSAR